MRASLLLLVCTCAYALAAEVRLESNVGVDTNVAKVETESAMPRSDTVLQAVLDVSESARLHQRVRLATSYQAGAKRFSEISGEDTLRQRLTGRLSFAPTGWLALALDGRLEDRATRDPEQSQDRARMLARPEVQLRAGGFTGGLAFVAERHVFKADHDLNADSYGGDATLARAFGLLSTTLTGSARTRSSAGPPWVITGHDANGVAILKPMEDEEREDSAWYVRVGAQYGGTVLARAGYTYGNNESNHDRGNYALHSFEASVTASLPFEMLASARLYLLRIDHVHGFDVADRDDEAASFDGEARSSLTLRLERPVDDHWSVVLRGSTWTLPTGGPDFRRELASLGVAWVP